ncbi:MULTISPECIES: hypothetical protein [Acidipropionibacterium]|uniref:hypothetical protein n=1 Tax=Acidipropionibacterium TaxID=1912215 RepID=UPI0003FBDE99|nr:MULTISPECIES: hypothetical protein [Acidipropionibacterium]
MMAIMGDKEDRLSKEERRAAAAEWVRGEYGPGGYTYGVSKLVTGLMVLSGVLYLLSPWAMAVCLAVAIMAILGRRMLERQATGDFSDLAEAKKQYNRSRNGEYLDFIVARCTQMLRDNKALRPESKKAVSDYLDWAERRQAGNARKGR